MSDYVLNGKLIQTHSESDEFEGWSAETVADYVARQGLGQYRQSIITHRITGELVPFLNENHMAEMGVKCIGDRLRFGLIVERLKRKSLIGAKAKILWQGEEKVFYSIASASICTLCGCCPIDPSIYKLQQNHLKIKKVNPFRCFGVRCCCCGSEYVMNNVDLSHVQDIDINGVPAPCFERIFFCAEGKDIVNIEIRSFGEGASYDHKLVLPEREGEYVASLIMNGVEAQNMER